VVSVLLWVEWTADVFERDAGSDSVTVEDVCTVVETTCVAVIAVAGVDGPVGEIDWDVTLFVTVVSD
jgi:hypothetical protein